MFAVCRKRDFTQIWNIGLEKVGGRPAKLSEEKGDRDLEREIKNKTFFVGRTT